MLGLLLALFDVFWDALFFNKLCSFCTHWRRTSSIVGVEGKVCFRGNAFEILFIESFKDLCDEFNVVGGVTRRSFEIRFTFSTPVPNIALNPVSTRRDISLPVDSASAGEMPIPIACNVPCKPKPIF